MESKTNCSALLHPSVHDGVEDGKLYSLCKPSWKTICGECCVIGDAQSHRKQKDENNLMCSEIQIRFQLNKMAEMESVPHWSGLLTELLVEIALKLSLIEDFTSFKGVCTSWRAAANNVSKLPLLMLPEKAGDNNVREFYRLCKNKIRMRIPVPEAKGKRCIGAGFGWILTVANSGGELNLVKPMSSSKIKLPNMKTFPEYESCYTWPEYNFIKRAAVSANPSETSDFVLVVFANMYVGFWRNGDSHWTKLEMIPNKVQGFANICYYKHKMYAIGWSGEVWMWDPYLTQAPELLLTLHNDYRNYMDLAYLVESSKGELLLIVRTSAHQRDPEENSIFIIQIDTVNKDYSELDHLDRDAIFIGQNSAAVSANVFPGAARANCIYFTDDDHEQYYPYPDGHAMQQLPLTDMGFYPYGHALQPLPGTDMGIYNVEDQSFERFDVESYSYICPPMWIFPSH